MFVVLSKAQGFRILQALKFVHVPQVVVSPSQQTVLQLLNQGLIHDIALETRDGTEGCLLADPLSEPEQTAIWPAIEPKKGCSNSL